MAFQIKDFTSIAASAINWMRSSTTKVTDFNVGSVVRTMIEAIASEIEELYQQMFIGLREAIPVSVYNSFDFARIEAVPASGLVRVTVTASSSPITITAATVLSTPGSQITYTVTQDATIEPGNTFVDVHVVASSPGVAGNLPGGRTFTLSPTPNGFIGATNPSGFINGLDQETDDQRKLRFNAFIASLNRGTVAALEYGLKTTVLRDAAGNETERVVSTSVVEPWLIDASQPIALVNCYIHNGAGGTSDALVNRARDVMYGYYDENGNAVPGWKAAGVQVNVYPAYELPLSISGEITTLPGFDESAILSSAETMIAEYIRDLGIGKTFQVASMIDAVMEIAGVSNFVPSDHAPPAAPTLGSSAGGALAAETYFVAVTYVTPSGETLPSVSESLAVDAAHVLTVASPAALTGAVGWNVYVGTSSGSLQKQNGVPLTLGEGYIEPESGLVAGTAPPEFSTARLEDIQVSASQKLMPGLIDLT